MDDDDDCKLRIRALPIDLRSLPKNFDPNIPPTNGEEYLQRVIIEASKCEQVVVANVDPTKFKQQDYVNPLPGCERAPEAFIPSREWQLCQVADFSAQRQKIAKLRTQCTFPPVKLPASNFEKGWYNICIGAASEDDKEKDVVIAPAAPPFVSYLLNPSMTQQAIEHILAHNISWMENGFSVNQAKWLYALLVCLELPLTPSLCSTLRSLARESSKLRALLNDPDHEFLAPLNLIICLVAHYFQQTDLAD